MNFLLKLLLALVLPSMLLAACCTIGMVLLLMGRRIPKVRHLGSVLLGFGVLGIIVAFILPVDVLLLRPLENRFPASSVFPTHVDGVVVLGGAVSAALSLDRAMPSLNRDGDRIATFAALARLYPEAKLVFAGGPPATAAGVPTEAEASRDLLERLGVSPSRLLIDDQSRTTWENAVNARALAQPRPGETWLLVTSASHMPRAVGAFRGAGWPPVLAWPTAYRTPKEGWPSLMQPVAGKLAAIDLAAHEWVGLLAYRLEGRTDRLLPRP